MSSLELQQVREMQQASTPEPEEKKSGMNGEAGLASKPSAKPQKGIMGMFANKSAPKNQDSSKDIKSEHKEDAPVVSLCLLLTAPSIVRVCCLCLVLYFRLMPPKANQLEKPIQWPTSLVLKQQVSDMTSLSYHLKQCQRPVSMFYCTRLVSVKLCVSRAIPTNCCCCCTSSEKPEKPVTEVEAARSSSTAERQHQSSKPEEKQESAATAAQPKDTKKDSRKCVYIHVGNMLPIR